MWAPLWNTDRPLPCAPSPRRRATPPTHPFLTTHPLHFHVRPLSNYHPTIPAPSVLIAQRCRGCSLSHVVFPFPVASVPRLASRSRSRSRSVYALIPLTFSLYKILFHFETLLWESIIFLLPPPLTCKAHPIAIRLHDHCAIYAPPPTTPLCMPYTIHYW